MFLTLLCTALADDAPRYPDLQISVHGGLLQPLVARGFNAAVDVRHRRFVATYSHGEGLDISALRLSREQRDQGARVRMPWTTGFGVGATLIDELYVLTDFKVHRYEVDSGIEKDHYTTVTLGGEVGYRLFIGRVLFVSPVVRWWPNVYASQSTVGLAARGGGEFTQSAEQQGIGGLFANVLIGGAFDVQGKRRTGTFAKR